MSRPRRLRTLSLLATVVLTVVMGCSSATGPGSVTVAGQGFVSGDGTVAQLPPSRRATPVELAGTTLDGKRLSLSALRGNVVVLNVWASWCAPCIAEAPALEAVHEMTAGKGVSFVGLNFRDDPASAKAHERRFGVTYPSIEDTDGRGVLALRGVLPPKAVPTTLVIDRQGRVAARSLAKIDRVVLTDLVNDVLAEPRS